MWFRLGIDAVCRSLIPREVIRALVMRLAGTMPRWGAGARRTLEGTATVTRTVDVPHPSIDGHACHICGWSGWVVVGDRGNFRLLCTNGECIGRHALPADEHPDAE